MSWPLKYDPASQSISFGGRDKTLYPNKLIPFDQAVLAAGDFCRTYYDHDSSKRPISENELVEVREEKVESRRAESTSPGEDCCASDTSLHNTTSISYPKINQLEETRQRRFVENLARGKWNRYRRQYTSNTSYEAHKSTNSLSRNNRASTFYHFPPYVPCLTLSNSPYAAFNNQTPSEPSPKDRNTEGGERSSVHLPANPAAIYQTKEKDLVTVNIDHGTSEAKASTLAERHCSPQSCVEEKQVPIRAYGCPRQARFDFKQSFFQKMLHPKDNIIKPAIQLAREILCLKHNKMQQSEKQPSDVDIAKEVLSKGDVKEWKVMRGYSSLFSRKWVRSVAQAIEKGKEEEKWWEAVAL